MRVAVLTFHKAPSCGAMLQAWALKTVLSRMGHSVEFPDCNSIGFLSGRWPYRRPPQRNAWRALRAQWRDFLDNVGSIGIYHPAMARFDAFRAAHLPERSVCPSEFGSHYACAVFGSDQVWNAALTQGDAAVFLGEGVPASVRKVSYAASVGDGTPEPAALARLQNAVKGFDAVSVRESKLVDLLGRDLSRPVCVTLDPTLLLDAEAYRPLATPSHPARNYLYVYALYHHDAVFGKARALSRELGLQLVYTPLYQYTRKGMPRGVTYGVSPDMFVDLMANASCVLTDSFHGTAFALLNRKPFVTYRLSSESVQSRPSALLDAVGLQDRILSFAASQKQIADRLTSPIGETAYERLRSLREASVDWLRQAISPEI